MTDMSGFDLAKEAHRRRPSLRVLCISGYLDRERPKDTPGLTLNFLLKPFSAEELAAKVRDVLGSSRPG
jgi:DNA-binding NtrC family response regulator